MCNAGGRVGVVCFIDRCTKVGGRKGFDNPDADPNGFVT